MPTLLSVNFFSAWDDLQQALRMPSNEPNPKSFAGGLYDHLRINTQSDFSNWTVGLNECPRSSHWRSVPLDNLVYSWSRPVPFKSGGQQLDNWVDETMQRTEGKEIWSNKMNLDNVYLTGSNIQTPWPTEEPPDQLKKYQLVVSPPVFLKSILSSDQEFSRQHGQSLT